MASSDERGALKMKVSDRLLLSVRAFVVRLNCQRVLARLRKAAGKRKFRVAFLVSELAKWKCQSVFDRMCASGEFEPVVAVYNLTRLAGYPTEDLFCCFMSAVGRLSWWERGERRRILANFAEVVRMLPYSAHEWRTAINALFVSKLRNKIKASPSLGWWSVAKLLDRAWLDERCREIAANAAGQSDMG